MDVANLLVSSSFSGSRCIWPLNASKVRDDEGQQSTHEECNFAKHAPANQNLARCCEHQSF